MPPTSSRSSNGLQTLLGAAGYATAWASGRSLTAAEAITLALAVDVPQVTASTSQPAARHDLTERELEVLRLLAAGHTNREIGDQLFISPATAARHVLNIYRKLDVDSRAKATMYCHQHGLV